MLGGWPGGLGKGRLVGGMAGRSWQRPRSAPSEEGGGEITRVWSQTPEKKVLGTAGPLPSVPPVGGSSCLQDSGRFQMLLMLWCVCPCP